MKKSKQLEPAPIAAAFTTTGHIVMQGGKPCTLANVTGGKKGGVLLPGMPVVDFLQVRDARRAIARTERVRETLRGSLVDNWDRLQPLFDGGAYEIIPLGRQTAAATPEEAAKA